MAPWPFGRGPTLPLGSLANGFPLLPTRVRLRGPALFAHEHLLGVSGMGKSKRLEAKYLQLHKQGIAVSLIDPHAESADAVLAHLVAQGFFRRPGAYERVLYVRFADGDHVTPFNVLRQEHLTPDVIIGDVVESFHRAFPELAQGAAQFDTLVGNGVRVCLDNDLPLTALYELLLDPAYRQRLLSRVQAFGTLAYFAAFARLREGERAEQSLSTLRRLNLLTTAPVLEYGLSGPENLLPFRHFLDAGVSVLYSLGHVQNLQARRLLGCLLMVGYERAALSRLGQAQRRPHMLIVDEAGQFSATSAEALSTMLSETRKVGLFVTLSHQTWGQFGDKLHGALQNVGIKTLMRVGREDAEVMARWFGAVDPLRIKSEAKTAYTQPVFYELGGQWEELVAYLTALKPRHAYVKVGEQPPVEVVSPTVRAPKVDPVELAEVQAEQRRRMTRPKGEIVLPYQSAPAEEIASRRLSPIADDIRR